MKKYYLILILGIFLTVGVAKAATFLYSKSFTATVSTIASTGAGTANAINSSDYPLVGVTGKWSRVCHVPGSLSNMFTSVVTPYNYAGTAVATYGSITYTVPFSYAIPAGTSTLNTATCITLTSGQTAVDPTSTSATIQVTPTGGLSYGYVQWTSGSLCSAFTPGETLNQTGGGTMKMISCAGSSTRSMVVLTVTGTASATGILTGASSGAATSALTLAQVPGVGNLQFAADVDPFASGGGGSSCTSSAPCPVTFADDTLQNFNWYFITFIFLIVVAFVLNFFKRK